MRIGNALSSAPFGSLRRVFGLLVASATVACSAAGPDDMARGRSDEATCVSYGYRPGTTGYTLCIQREIDARKSGKVGPAYDQPRIALGEP
jgi:hypothetical protein